MNNLWLFGPLSGNYCLLNWIYKGHQMILASAESTYINIFVCCTLMRIYIIYTYIIYILCIYMYILHDI